MKVEQLRSFVALYETENFTATAERLYTVQPVITRRISTLEEELGFRLFERTTKKVAPTDEGSVLYPRVKEALSSLDQGIAVAKALSDGKRSELKVGFNYLYMDKTTPRSIGDYNDAHPDGPKATIIESSPLSLIGQVVEHEIDCAFVGMTDTLAVPAGLAWFVVDHTDERILVSRSHRLAGRKYLSIHDLVDETFVYPFVEPSSLSSPVKKDFEVLKLQPKVVKTEFSESALRITEMSEAIIDLPSTCPVEGYDLVSIPYRSSFRIDYCFIWNPRKEKPGFSGFRDFIRSLSPDRTDGASSGPA